MTILRIAAAGLSLLLAAGCSTPAPPRAEAGLPACSPPSGSVKMTPTTIDVVERAYFCILGESQADGRELLTVAFAALVRKLVQDGRDLPGAVMPALTGDRVADWAAFETRFRVIADRLPVLRDGLAALMLVAMVGAVRHARWERPPEVPPDHHDGDGYGLGLRTSAPPSPLFVTAVDGGPARAAGLRPGDVIESADGELAPVYPDAHPVRLRLLRPGTGRRWSVTLTPGVYPRDPAALRVVRSESRGGVAYVRVSGFPPDAANRALRAISRLRAGRVLTGVVLDLRGNGDGSSTEAVRLLSAFVHEKVTAHGCTADGRCQGVWTDDTVPLLGLPLVVLVDHGCAAACEHFAAAVKDLRAGTLVGARTAGAIPGPARRFDLGNGTTLSLPHRHHLGPGGEVVDGIGVPPDRHVPPTARDAAAGRDRALEAALTLLRP
ncbi:S41 family peptidase [Herbidospora daliensis]|uniref:S41 family peptidase n=1 Tax=Herbidospora daliensis TaxID=295585 RepID=UPI000780C98D|nr:S41 family peptidase [Herbidospora daliensis]